jgi:bacteriocin biosynthesis cyclodehydratase domain-containing protein
MILALKPSLPVVWRSPTSLQIGVDRPVVVLYDVGTADEHLLAALTAGVSRSGLDMIGRTFGADEHAVSGLLARVRPALAEPEPAVQPERVVVEGDSRCMVAVRSAIEGAGHLVVPRPVRHSEARARRFVDLAVAVVRYVLPPAASGYWSRRDIPLLPVVFGDSRVTVGPLVEPGVTTCLHCVDRFRTDADPSWPAIASQLVARPSAAEIPLVSAEAAAFAARAVHTFLRERRNPLAGLAVTIDAATGAFSRRAWPPHPECGCRVLPGTATAFERRTGADRSRSTTGGGLAEPA